MELLSNALAHHSVPDRYVFPPDKRPALLSDDHSPDVAFPVIDLHGGVLPVSDHRRRQAAEEIIRAAKEFGFFQVVNHGVGEGVVRAFREAAEGFFAMPAEEKLPYCSYDMSKRFRLASSTSYDRGETRYWRDYIKFRCYLASHENARHWPSKPPNFTPSLVEYSAAVHELAQTILCLIAEGLGLDGGFFTGDLSGGDTHMSVNYYPPCPDPTVTMGLLAHCDRHLLTVLSQADIAGLQARHGERWLLVHPIPAHSSSTSVTRWRSSPGCWPLASVEHRAVTSSAVARMSVATHVHPSDGCRIRPAPEIVDEAMNPAKYREFAFSEFMEAYDAADASREEVLQSFKIHYD